MLPDVGSSADWTFLSNHGHVLVALARDPEATMREVAQQVGITERAVQLLVRDLQQAGYVQITRVGRRNRYTVATQLPLRHPLEQDTSIGDFLGLLSSHQSPAV
jgi:DNA-binding MarR family transcriptional regulator